MISKILRDTLAQVIAWENENPNDARGIAPGLFSLKFQIHAVLQYIERPTAEDLELSEEPPEWDEPVLRLVRRH